jgi:hypothetical protein
MIAWIIGIVVLLIISLFITDKTDKTDKTIESFDYNPPTVMPTKIRSDLTCSDPEQSAIFDRFNKSAMQLMGSDLQIPPSMRNPRLEGPENTVDTAKEIYYDECIGLTDKNDVNYQKKKGTKVFIEKDEKFTRFGISYKKVDLLCCKGELYQPPGTNDLNARICLVECPTDYTISSSDKTICLRNDSTCTYTEKLSANIQNNWSKTCAALYKQNANIFSTINSISTVVSTFSIQSSTIKTNYTLLNNQLATYGLTHNDVYSINYNNNFSNITSNYSNLYSNIQSNISDRYNTLRSDKLKFDTLFNNLGCSNFM